MLYTDGNGFPLTLKPSHLFGSTERMDAAEVLSAIVEEACRYEPASPREMFKSTSVEQKMTRTSVERKEAPTDSENVYPKEALTSVKKVPVASDFVRFISFELACFKAVVGLPICLV